MTPNSVLYDLDEHIRMMDEAGIDAAFLTSPPGMCVDTDLSRLINDKTKAAEKDYPGRFIGGAHANPLGGPDALRELARAARSSSAFPASSSPPRSMAPSSTIRRWSRSGTKSPGSACSYSSIRR